MDIQLKCFATLVNPNSCDFNESTVYEMNPEQTVGDLLKRAAIPAEDVKVVFVNGRIVDLDTVLNAGDRVGLAPAVGGM